MKKVISIILALVMTLAVLTACGSSTQPAATSAPAPAANDAAASAEPAKDVRLLKPLCPPLGMRRTAILRLSSL